MTNYLNWVGKAVQLKPIRKKKNKPRRAFESGKTVATIKEIFYKYQMLYPFARFNEDQSEVQCTKLELADESLIEVAQGVVEETVEEENELEGSDELVVETPAVEEEPVNESPVEIPAEPVEEPVEPVAVVDEPAPDEVADVVEEAPKEPAKETPIEKKKKK